MTTIIIPAAGFGTRMRPLSTTKSKCLIPVCGKPMLEWILDSIKKQGFEKYQIVIVENEKTNDIQEYIKTLDIATQKTITIKKQSWTSGPGGAVIEALESVYNPSCVKEYHINDVLIWLSDTICLKNFDYSHSFYGVKKVDPATYNRWCLIDNANNMYDKQTLDEIYQTFQKYEYVTDLDWIRLQSELSALIGIYYIKDAIIPTSAYLPKINYGGVEYQLKDLFESLKETEKFNLVDVNGAWYDCGELETYYKSCGLLINNLSREQTNLIADYDIGTITKKANPAYPGCGNKLHNEYLWYTSHSNIYRKLCTPKIIEYTENPFSYTMSLESGSTLSEIFLYEDIRPEVWTYVIKKLLTLYKKACYDFSIERENQLSSSLIQNMVNEFYRDRSIHRLKQYKVLYERCDFNFRFGLWENFINDFIDKYCAYLSLSGNKTIFSITETDNVHGDFHFDNILFDPIKGKFVFLDPRGGDFYKDTVSGLSIVDSLYDLAKLYHSIYGYMVIMSNRDIQYYQERLNVLEGIVDTEIGDKDLSDLAKQLAVICILTCIPFHLDNQRHCQRLLYRANELREIFIK